MRLVFCLFKYFPYGGLQRDFMAIVNRCLERGHEVHVLTQSWEGQRPKRVRLTEIPVRSLRNHARCAEFNTVVGTMLPKLEHDVVVGFNKMAGLDVYFAADTCYQARVLETKSPLYKLTSRYRTYQTLEKAVFAPDAGTEILLLSSGEKDKFIQYYRTPEERFHLLPPGISNACFRNTDSAEIRRQVRQEHRLGEDEFLLLMVGSAFRTKGVDRAIAALASLPQHLREKTRLLVIGKGDSGTLTKLARKSGVADRTIFLGGRDDVPRYLVAADLLVHPARLENTGTVLVEALAAGLPVLATANCGYAFHVEQADAGVILPEPFDQQGLNGAMAQMLGNPELKELGLNGYDYTQRVDVTSLHARAVEIIEAVGARKGEH